MCVCACARASPAGIPPPLLQTGLWRATLASWAAGSAVSSSASGSDLSDKLCVQIFNRPESSKPQLQASSKIPRAAWAHQRHTAGILGRIANVTGMTELNVNVFCTGSRKCDW